MENQNLIEALGLQDLPTDAKKQIIEDVSRVLELRSLEKVYEGLSEEKQSELDSLLEEANSEKLVLFLRENVQNMQEIYQQELTKIKEELSRQLQEYKDQIANELSETLGDSK